MTRSWAWATMVLVLLAALAFGATGAPDGRSDADRVYDLSTTLRCPVCTSQSVASSESTTSRQMREEISRQVEAGRTDAEVRQFFVDRYGESVLLVPPTTGVGGMVWVIPIVAVAAAGAGLAMLFARRSRRRGAALPSEADEELVAAALATSGDRNEPTKEDR